MRLTPLVCRVPSIGMEHRPPDASRWTGLFRLAHPAPPVATAVEGSAGAWPAAGVTWEAAASPASALPPGRLNELSAGLSPPSESQVVGRGSVRGGSAVSRGRQLLRKASQFCGVSAGSSQGLGGRCPFCCVVETKAGRSPGCSSQGPFLRLPWRDAQQLLRASWGPGPGQVLGGSGERRQLHLWVLLVTAGGQTALAPGGIPQSEGVLCISCMFLALASTVTTLLGSIHGWSRWTPLPLGWPQRGFPEHCKSAGNPGVGGRAPALCWPGLWPVLRPHVGSGWAQTSRDLFASTESKLI